jgi:hypothetical protein
MATSLAVHYVNSLTFKQDTLFMEDDSMVRFMRVMAIDKNGEVNEITLFLTENCRVEEVLT